MENGTQTPYQNYLNYVRSLVGWEGALFGAIGNKQLRPDAIGSSSLADDSVTTSKIVGSNVTNAKLASSSVDGRVVASEAIGSTEVTSGAIHGSHITNYNNAGGTGNYGAGTFTDLRASTSISANGTAGITTIGTIVDRSATEGTTTYTFTFRYGLLTAIGTV